MARILVNYTYNKAKDEYKILDYTCGVLADMKVAILELEEDIDEPLVVPIDDMMTVVDRSKYELTHKKFCLVADETGKVIEHPKGKVFWFPKDTDISKLRVINGQVVMVEEDPVEETDEQPIEEHPVEPKKVTKPRKPKIKTEA